MRLAGRSGRPRTAKPASSNGGELYSKATNDLENKLDKLNSLLKKNYDDSRSSNANRFHKLEVNRT